MQTQSKEKTRKAAISLSPGLNSIIKNHLLFLDLRGSPRQVLLTNA